MMQRANCNCGGLYAVRGGRLVCSTCGKPSPIAAKPPEGPVAGPHNHVAHDPQAWEMVGSQNRLIADMTNSLRECRERAELAEAALMPAYLGNGVGAKNWKAPQLWLDGVRAILEKAGLVDAEGKPVIKGDVPVMVK